MKFIKTEVTFHSHVASAILPSHSVDCLWGFPFLQVFPEGQIRPEFGFGSSKYFLKGLVWLVDS